MRGDVEGVVAAGHPLTARAGAQILAQGGNAVDAAVGAAFAASVAESALIGPGAGGFMLVDLPGQAPQAWDFFVAAPGLGDGAPRLHPDMLDAFTVPFGGADQVFHIGPASVAVPGMVQGLCQAVEEHGTLGLTDLVAPAVALAREGVVLSDQVGYLHRILGAMLTHTPECAAVYAPHGTLVTSGGRIRFPELAETLQEIGNTGAAAMAPGGWLATRIIEFLERSGGLVNTVDISSYRVERRVPLRIRFRDLDLYTNPPPSAGGLLIACALACLAEDPVPRDEIAHYRAVAMAGEVANAVRGPTFMDDLHRDDLPADFWMNARMNARRIVHETRKPAGSTTHISVMDTRGGTASLSGSNGAGSGVMVPGTGVLLNNMLGEQDLNPGGFGLVPPGRRMISMMAPTIAMRGHEPVIAIGSAGSNRLRSAIAQTIVSIVDGGLPVADAVHRPRVHPEGGGLDVEGGISSKVCAALEADGHRLRRWGEANLFFGGVSAVGRVSGVLEGAGDPRRGGGAAGVTRQGEVVDLWQ